MSHRYSFPDGTPVPPNVCVKPDQHRDTFTITVNSLEGVTAEALKDLIQTRFEVKDIRHDDRHTIIRDYRPANRV